MRKILYLLIIPFLLSNQSCTKDCLNSDIAYVNVDVFNGWGNVVDFIFTYDSCNECVNNFTIVNNTQYQLSYNFNIYQNGILVYTGYFIVSPYGSVYFNNAFNNCSMNPYTEVTIY